jgi:hypothetical protein
MRPTVVWFLWWRSRIFVYRKLVHPNPLRHISFFEELFTQQVKQLGCSILGALDGKAFFGSTNQTLNGFSRRSEWNLLFPQKT